MGISNLFQDGVSMGPAAVALSVAAVALTFFLLSSKRPKHPVALDSDNKIPFRLIEKEKLSHDTRRFRFALQSEEHILGLPVGKHVSFSFTDSSGKLVSRSYTPVTGDNVLGYVDFVIKVYFANVHPKFPEGGKMSQHLESLAIGDTIDMRGPKGKLTYVSRGRFEVRERLSSPAEKKFATDIGMIAGGTGITPMLQVVRKALMDSRDKTRFNLIFANQTPDDILLRDELERLADSDPRFKVWFTVDKADSDWKFSVGYVNADMIKSHLPPPSPTTHIFMCGPPPMIKFACMPALEQLQYSEENIFSF